MSLYKWENFYWLGQTCPTAKNAQAVPGRWNTVALQHTNMVVIKLQQVVEASNKLLELDNNHVRHVQHYIVSLIESNLSVVSRVRESHLAILHVIDPRKHPTSSVLIMHINAFITYELVPYWPWLQEKSNDMLLEYWSSLQSRIFHRFHNGTYALARNSCLWAVRTTGWFFHHYHLIFFLDWKIVKETSPKRCFLLTAWALHEHVMRWFLPDNITMQSNRNDTMVGGRVCKT